MSLQENKNIMLALTYSIVKKNLASLYAENSQQGYNIDQYIGRAMYEYERITDYEEQRFIESFFFYLAVLKQVDQEYSNANLNNMFPEAVQFVSDNKNYQLVITCNDISKEDAKLIEIDYREIMGKI